MAAYVIVEEEQTDSRGQGKRVLGRRRKGETTGGSTSTGTRETSLLGFPTPQWLEADHKMVPYSTFQRLARNLSLILNRSG